MEYTRVKEHQSRLGGIIMIVLLRYERARSSVMRVDQVKW